MTKVISLLNEKGGVGKTTLATHVAAALAIRGYRTLLIDADPQGHSTILMGVRKMGGLYDIVAKERPWDDALTTPLTQHWAGGYATQATDLFLLPGNVETLAIPVITDPTLVLRERLSELEDWLDFVVIDTPPTPSALQAMIYIATTHLIYPAQAQHLALDGLAESTGRIRKLNKTREELGAEPVALLGIVPTMLHPQTIAHQHGLEQIALHFGAEALLPAITNSTVWRDREFALQTVYAYAPETRAEYEAWTLVDVIMARMGVTYAR